MNRLRIRTHVQAVAALVALVMGGLLPSTSDAATIKVVNNCTYTVFPGLYPATFRNGGWQQAAGTTVSFTVGAGWIGRLWPRKGCNNASPAQCATGSCGGTGLQCAGTTGQPNASLFEINVNASGTDWYDVSYVDVVQPTGASVTLDGQPVTAQVEPLSSGFGIARIQLGAGNGGAHLLTASEPVGVQVMGYGSYTSYQYPGGLNLGQIAPVPPR